MKQGEIVVDSFAGGGGASEGIKRALGYSPHIAINHDLEAIALHAANHPESAHYPEDVWHVDPKEACADRPVGLMWLSPDCKDFSKAKGGKPVSKNIRALAWVAVRWAVAVKPRVIILENVEEFEGWGPLLKKTNKRDPARVGLTFRRFVGRLRNLGYEVEWRQMRACDYGAPTIRKRLFLIARCDGQPIVWPKPTHGKGRIPWRTAAECIDWSVPCPSIFMTAKEIKEIYGVRAKRPLAHATLRRIGRGIQRFVIDNPEPFIVKFSENSVGQPASEPLHTVMAGAPRFGLVTPYIAGVGGRQGQSPERPLTKPVQTVTAKGGLCDRGPAPGAHAARQTARRPSTSRCRPSRRSTVKWIRQERSAVRTTPDILAPLPTVSASGDVALVSPTLIQTGYGEREGQSPRSLDITEPLGTVVGGGVKHAVVSAFLAKHYGDRGQRPGSGMDEPVSTITAFDHNALVRAELARPSFEEWFADTKDFGGSREEYDRIYGASDPTAPDGPVAAHIQRDFGNSVGSSMDTPVGAVTSGGGGKAAVVASHLLKLHGTAKDGRQLDLPLPTIRAAGTHLAEVRAFLIAYYGNEKDGGKPQDPMRTVTSNDRFGVVTVHGLDYVIADIGMRMLLPRELYRAQGFYDSYKIDIPYRNPKTGRVKPMSKEAQVRMVGNSVNPDLADALVSANCPDLVWQRMAA